MGALAALNAPSSARLQFHTARQRHPNPVIRGGQRGLAGEPRGLCQAHTYWHLPVYLAGFTLWQREVGAPFAGGSPKENADACDAGTQVQGRGHKLSSLQVLPASGIRRHCRRKRGVQA